MTTTVANMTAGRARSTGDLDMGRVLRVGAVTGAVMIYVSAIGMLATFNARLIINPILSIGYTLFFAIPFIAGTRFTQRQQLEGLTAEKPSGLDVVKALVAGAVGGLMVALFALVIDSFPEVRSTFPNLSPEMVEVITLGLGVGVGLVVIPAISAGVAAVGAAISFLPDRYRRAIAIGALTVVAFAMFQAVVDDFFDWFPALPDFLYQTPSGVSVVPAIILFLLGAAGSLFLPGRISSVGAGLRSQEGAARRRTTIIWAVVIGAALIVLPQFLGGILNELFVNVGFFALMALGLNVVIGYAGLLDLGYVAFFAVGAYTTGVLTSPISPTWDPMLSWWQAFPVVLVMAALAGLFVGTPVLRMRGDYLAIVTLGFGEIVRLLLLSDWLSPYFGGAQGIRNIPGIPVFGTEINVTTPNLMIYMVAFFVLLAAFISWRLEHSRIGRAWAALREDEDVAEAVGVDTVKAKLTAFITGAVIASFAGALFAAKVGSVFTNSFEILVSIVILVIVIVGGMGNIVGVVVGAFVLIGILGGPNQPGLLQEFGEYRLLMYGALLVFMMLRRPEGLVPSKRRQQELHQEEFLQDAWLDKGGHFVNPDDHTPQRPGPSAAEPGRGKE
ncbi:MAG: leucine/isoleucine/valine transporter permease subunit [Acidimicrobiia bacterium]|jgi:branched-chain amino acid transport system permease protein